MCGLWLMGEGWTHSAAGEGGGEDRDELGENGAEKQGCVPGALMLGIAEPSAGFWHFLQDVSFPAAQARGRGQAGDGGSCFSTANYNQKVVVPARGGGLQLICILLSLQMEACLVADYTGGYLLAKHCTVLIFPFCLFRL